VLVVGVFWGLWHAPVLLLGYDYPLQAPVVRVLLMVGMCMVLGCLLGWLRICSGSVWPAAIGHGFVNAVAGLPVLFATAGVPVDNATTGLLGWTGWVVMAAGLGVAAAIVHIRNRTTGRPFGSPLYGTSGPAVQGGPALGARVPPTHAADRRWKGAPMRALVVVESIFGNTRAIGEAVAAGLAQHMHRAGVLQQPVGPEPDLVGRFLAAGVEHCTAGRLQPRGRLEQQRRFADSRLTANERHRARDDSTPQNEIEFRNPRPPPGE